MDVLEVLLSWGVCSLEFEHPFRPDASDLGLENLPFTIEGAEGVLDAVDILAVLVELEDVYIDNAPLLLHRIVPGAGILGVSLLEPMVEKEMLKAVRVLAFDGD